MSNLITLGAWLIRTSENSLVLDGRSYAVEPLAMDVLIYFVKNPYKVISRDELVDKVWQGRVVGDHAVYRVINLLRKTLKHDQGLEYIKTIRKKGYQLNKEFVDNITFELTQSGESIEVKEVVKETNKNRSHLGITLLILIVFILITLLLIKPFTNPKKEIVQYKNLKPFSVLNGEEKDPAFSKDSQFVAYSYRAGADEDYKVYIQPQVGSAKKLTQGIGNDVSPSWSENGEAIVFARITNEECSIIMVMLMKSYQESKLLDCYGHGIDNEVVWGRDNFIYYTSSGSRTEPYKIYRYSMTTGKNEQLTNPEVGRSKGDIFFALSNNSQFLAYKRDLDWGNTEIRLLDLKTRKSNKLFKLNGWKKGLAWSKDDRYLFYIDTEDRIFQYEVSTGKQHQVLTSQVSIHALTADPNTDNILIMTGDTGSDITINTMDNTNEESFISSSEVDVYPEFANTSMQVAFLSSRSGEMQIWLKSKDGEEQQLTNFSTERFIQRIRWSPNDRYIASSSYNRLYIVDVLSGEEKTIWSFQRNYRIEAPSWSEDGEYLYFSSDKDGDWQTYKVNLIEPKEPEKMTTEGSYGAIEANNKLIYFKYHFDGLWVKNLSTKKESQLTVDTNIFAYDSLYPSDNGVFYVAIDSEKGNRFKHIEFDSGRVRDMMPISNPLIDVSVSFNNEWVLTPKIYRNETAIKLLEVEDNLQ